MDICFPHTPGRDRTDNLLLRRQAPYPLGHGGELLIVAAVTMPCRAAPWIIYDELLLGVGQDTLIFDCPHDVQNVVHDVTSSCCYTILC